MTELRMPVRRRLGMVALTVAVLGALTGCVGIPHSGPVTQGLSLDTGSGTANFEFNPEGPEKGAKPSEILTGFVAAFTSATGGYAVARQYLSDSFAGKWDPRQSVQVRSGAPRLSTLLGDTIDYSFSAVATVDASGSYRESSEPVTMRFGFVKQNGQWRINSAPSGIVLPSENFKRIFSQAEIYFFDPTSEHLVPDVRWFPNGTAATRIVAALLAGPPEWLSKAVRTEFPDGTRLSDSGSVVTVESGVAKVDLTKEAQEASAKERELMRLQLTSSLSSVPNISSVSISIEGAVLPIEAQDAESPQADAKVDSQALVYRRTSFGYYANNKVAALPQLSRQVVALGPRAATLSSDGESVAVLGTAGVSLVRQSVATPELLDNRLGLADPSLDEYGFVWSVPSESPNAIQAFDSTGAAHAVAGSLPADSQIASLEISRDGARVAILLSTSTGPRLIVAAIIRDPDQKQAPVSLGTPVVDEPLGDGQAVDATWVDQLTVATLVSGGVESSVDSFTIGGQRSSLGSLPAAQSIVGGNGLDGLRILGSDQTIWAYRGSSWQSSNVLVNFIATQR
ncbi:LpqB family beta-propeller domain-containing protein [soil metagenome]